MGHRGTVVSQKWAISFRRHPDFNFLEFLKMLLPSQLYENSRFRPDSLIRAPTFARFTLPIQKFPYRPFAKGTHQPPPTATNHHELPIANHQPPTAHRQHMVCLRVFLGKRCTGTLSFFFVKDRPLSEFVPYFEVFGTPLGGRGYVATMPTCGPLLILSPL